MRVDARMKKWWRKYYSLLPREIDFPLSDLYDNDMWAFIYRGKGKPKGKAVRFSKLRDGWTLTVTVEEDDEDKEIDLIEYFLKRVKK